ncbi:hypothetical protein C6P42_005035 [Pichia californica]|nr:hypothetical protein C6P42_005035 [[Candida] californica]
MNTIIFDNQTTNSGISISLEFSIKQLKKINDENTYVTAKIRNITLQTDCLENSVVYKILKNDQTNLFNIILLDLSSIKRLGLKNDILNFIISINESNDISNDNLNDIQISISILNILTLNTAKVKQLTKSFSLFLVDINFDIITNHLDVESSIINNYTKNFNSYHSLLKSNDNENHYIQNSNFNKKEKEENISDSYSMSSDISSLVSTMNNSSISLSSISNINNSTRKSNSNNNNNNNNNKPKSLNHLVLNPLHGSRRESRSNTSLLINSRSTSNMNSLATSKSDLSNSNPDLYHDDTDGFLILQIESATGLPPFRNSTKLGYDMDPFVVVSFSKQIFKTAVCRHALNPSWKNQLINIRVSKYSFNFQLKMSVYDFDFFAFNSDICSSTIEISNLINESEYNNTHSWTYKTLPLVFSTKSKSKKFVNLNDFFPELSIRFKYVSVASLLKLPHQFNPRKEKCPNCHKIDKRNNSALQHLSVCTLDLKPRQFLHKHYATSNNASRRWYSKVLAHIAYGRLTVGGNNAHILVQDRETGLVLEEKISAFVKLGIRLLYKSVKSDNSSEKIKRMLRLLSIKQGTRYDNPDSKYKIQGFVKFHGLSPTLNECLQPDLSKYNTFNEFFSRRLKLNARPVEGGTNNDVITSVADSRLVVFENTSNAKLLWIKGSGFTIDKLLGKQKNNIKEGNNENDCSIAIFRLAPQDYHRVHIPLNGKILKITQIHGSYYTVNPMAIRSSLDVFGENVRTVVTLETEEYGIVEIVLVGAMMVGSIIITVNINDYVKKGQELGYFKFGGSTVVLVFKKQENKSIIQWDGDLLSNSNKKLETLVKVGMSVGHASDKPMYFRGIKKEVSESERKEIIRRVTGIADEYQTGVSDTLKSKLGGMIDDVMSMKSAGRSFLGGDRNIDELTNDWEIQELTTLDGLNDDNNNIGNNNNNSSNNDVEIDIARPLVERELYQVLGFSDDDQDEDDGLSDA